MVTHIFIGKEVNINRDVVYSVFEFSNSDRYKVECRGYNLFLQVQLPRPSKDFKSK